MKPSSWSCNSVCFYSIVLTAFLFVVVGCFPGSSNDSDTSSTDTAGETTGDMPEEDTAPRTMYDVTPDPSSLSMDKTPAGCLGLFNASTGDRENAGFGLNTSCGGGFEGSTIFWITGVESQPEMVHLYLGGASSLDLSISSISGGEEATIANREGYLLDMNSTTDLVVDAIDRNTNTDFTLEFQLVLVNESDTRVAMTITNVSVSWR